MESRKCRLSKENFDGQIELSHLKFSYPNRPEVQVLKDFNLKIEPRMKTFFYFLIEKFCSFFSN